MAGPKYRPGEAAGSLKSMTREAVLATRGLSATDAAARATAKALASMVGPAVVAANARAAKSQGEAAASAGKLASEFDRAADRLSRFSLPKLDLKKALTGVFAGIATDKIVGKAAMPMGVGLAKAGIDATANKAADVSIGVSQAALRTGLAAAHFTVKTAVKGMANIAMFPITVASLGLKVGLGVAQALVYTKVKQMTGWSHLKMVLVYAGLRVGLAVATKLVKSAASTMARLAVIPFKVSFNLLKTGLQKATSMVKGAASSMASMLAAGPGGVAIAGLAGAGGASAAIFAAVKAASDLEETSSKVGYTFGKSAGIVNAGADEMAARFGTVKQEFLEGSAAVGLIGKAAGLSDRAAADLGVRATKLASDLASFANIGVDEALEKIRSGLVGEAEPLRTLGVLLSETAVKAQALKMGLGGVKGELSEGAKVQARAALIFEQTKSAQGDLARTADSLANRMRELWGRAVNLAATLGQYLLPAAKTLSAVFADMAKGVAERVEAGKSAFEGWAKTLNNAAGMVGVFSRNWKDFAAAGGSLAKDLGANVWEGLRVAFVNAINYAKYFANVAGQAIEKAIQNALHNALSSSNWTKSMAPEKFRQTVSFTPPKLEKGKFGMSDAFNEAVNGVKTFETFRALTMAAMRAKDVVADLGRTGFGMLKSKTEEVARVEKEREVFRAKMSQDAAAHKRDRDAEVLRAKMPRGFMTNRERSAQFKGGPAAALGGFNAMLAGGLGGAAGGLGGGLVGSVLGQLLTDKVSSAPRLAGLAEKGSQEAYSAIARNQAGGGKDKPAVDTAKNTAALVVETKRTNKLIDALKGQRLSAYSF